MCYGAEILREIYFGDFRGLKSAILVTQEVKNFDFVRILQFSRAEFYQK